ncbi:MAG: hypothetical protein M3349_02605 [Actinomycetota bacterium]|nr:hypothetical protein [Actinomycetota bacterium]
MMNRQTSIDPMIVTRTITAGDLATAAYNLRQAGLDPFMVARCPDTRCEVCSPATVAAA